MNSKQLIQLEEKYGAKNYKPLDVVINRAEGIWVYDVEGKKYLDFLSAYSAVNQGHCHPKITEALIEQAGKVALTSRAFRNDKLAGFYKKVSEITGLPKVLPMNSGAEAVETALKAVRKWGYKVKGVEKDKAEIIICADNFHGRTITIISFTTEEAYQDGFGPFTPGFKVIPYGDIDALKQAVTENTVAFMVEPIQGEAGIIVPPEGFLREAVKVCNDNNILFVLDEIQTGLGRTGKMFAHQWEDGVKPDAMILGKALSGGMYPVSAFVSSEEVMGVFNPGEHGSTFGGNPLAAAVGQAALEVIVEERLTDNSLEMGNYFMEKLRSIKNDNIKEVRGKGLLIGLELHKKAGGARRYCEALMDEGLLCKETHENVIRFAPPLVIKKDEIDWAFDKIEKVINEL